MFLHLWKSYHSMQTSYKDDDKGHSVPEKNTCQYFFFFFASVKKKKRYVWRCIALDIELRKGPGEWAQRPIRWGCSQERGPSCAGVPSEIALPSPTRSWESWAARCSNTPAQAGGMLLSHVDCLPRFFCFLLSLSLSLALSPSPLFFTYKVEVSKMEWKT